MSTFEPLIIATAAATGASIAMPEEYNPTMSILLSVLGISSGVYSQHLARQNQADAALNASMASIMFSLLSLAKSLGLV